MAFEHIVKKITGGAPGYSIDINYYRIGPSDAVKKVYLQGALHADEQPGIMVLHHLLLKLREADTAGELKAQFVVFPMVNPVGMANIMFRKHQGRYHWPSGVNFNRQWPNLFEVVRDEVSDQLGDNAEANVALIRQAVSHWLDELNASTSLEQQRRIIMREAFDADYVLDLHCDNDALKHVFITPDLLPEFSDLSDWVGAAATLTCADSGGASFDEVWSGLWTKLIAAFPDKNIPHATCSATLEYRGEFDVFDELNSKDADNLYGFFQARGLIGGTPVAKPGKPAPKATDLAATEMLRVNQAGLLAYKVSLGEQVEKGQLIAELIALDGEEAFIKRTPVVAGTRGVVISRNINKYVWPGCSIAKIVGEEILESRGTYLLED
ncbi:MAG: succinylglutamate desuccinylase/aspartoacylase family protein [Gammaproteobacteria bacterium]|nr:succinylglutamate desuccinylase/aspartoacylase family protein [Gammaproteobacteria bacterium]